MKKQFLSLVSMILLSLVVVSCSDALKSVPQNNDSIGEQKSTKNLQKYDYVFRVVDVSVDNDARFLAQINTHQRDLQKLASFFSNIINSESRSVANSDIVIHNLAQTAFTAYSTPEVHMLLNDLANDGVYIQFAYKEFLIDQCVISDTERSINSSFAISTKRTLVFNGNTTNPTNWTSEYHDVKFIETTSGTRSLSDEAEPSVTLTIANENREVILAYLESYADVVSSAPNAILTKQDDGSYLVTNGDMTTVIGFDGNNLDSARGLWDKIVKTITTAISKPLYAVNTIAFLTVVAVSALSGVGVITLPAIVSTSVTASATSASASIGLVFFL
jgi:hypothetical protein